MSFKHVVTPAFPLRFPTGSATGLFRLLRALLLASVSSLQSCGWLSWSGGPPATGFGLRSPESLGQELTAYQQIQVDFERETFNLQSAVDITRDRIQIVLMDPLGQRLATLVYDGRELRRENQRWMIPKFPPSYMLETLQMIFWPLPSLRQPGWRFGQRDNIRTAHYKDRLVAETEYFGPSPWTGKLQHTNNSENYKLQISSILLNSRMSLDEQP